MTILAPEKTKPVEKEVTTPIRPDEAYRLGRMMEPEWTNNTIYAPGEGACAYGATALGLGIIRTGKAIWQQDIDNIDIFRDRVKASVGKRQHTVRCACDPLDYGSGSRKMHLMDAIEHYSDIHRETFGSDENILKLLKPRK